jgi:hypothetical protein
MSWRSLLKPLVSAGWFRKFLMLISEDGVVNNVRPDLEVTAAKTFYFPHAVGLVLHLIGRVCMVADSGNTQRLFSSKHWSRDITPVELNRLA